jgi:hypothetical protein
VQPRHPAAAGWRLDLLVAAALFVASSVWGTQSWNAWTARGGTPEFYQLYFEPAVMIACGKGFVISEQQPKPLEDFLWRRRDRLACSDLPPDLKVGKKGIYQGAWIYLEYTVGLFWRAAGISWSGMGPLFGLLFGSVIALAYGISRLGMGRLFALGPPLARAGSSAHLVNLPHLRDYAKAPFTLALVFILGLLVVKPVRSRTVLLLAVIYGVVLGVGYGFRTDFLTSVPLIVIALFLFLDGGLTQRLALKAAASVLFFATFLAVCSPVLASVYTKGGCQWHVALLGLQLPHDQNLRVASAPYDFGYVYGDSYVVETVSGFARRTQGVPGPLVYCSHEYDVQSGRYLKAIVASFPADMTVRAYASLFQIVELPFDRWTEPMPNWATILYKVRARFLRPRTREGALIVLAALVIVSAASLRLGAFLLFFLAYFGGYPAIQFQERHYFHLEFITWWALAFVAYQATTIVWSWRAGVPDLRPHAGALARGAGLVLAGGATLALVLVAARSYQVRQAQRLFQSYVAAPKARTADDVGPLREVARGEWPQFLEVDLNGAACSPGTSVTFRYDHTVPTEDFTRTIAVGPRLRPDGLTRVFMPVFERFSAVEMAGGGAGCMAGAYRLTDLTSLPLLLGATLPPDWASIPLFQRLGT